MPNKLYISDYCTIENNKVIVDGEAVFESAGESFVDFAKQAYNHFDIAYPKFFKMDNMSKLAFLAADVLLKKEIKKNIANNIALLFANKSSSLDTDVKFNMQIQDSENYFPSPAVFVYTLPNICMGEISIRHQLYTENSFFIFADFNPDFFANYTSILLEGMRATSVLCGWVEFYKDDYRAFVYLVTQEGTLQHTADNIKRLYNK